MIRYAVLGSGSSGNSYMMEFADDAILFDVGFSYRQLELRSLQAGMDLASVRGVCITHLHPDHCRGAGVFARKTGKPVFVHREVVGMQVPELVRLGIPEDQIEVFDPLVPFRMGPFSITAFPTSHDSPSSVGFHVGIGGRCFTLLTDTGRFDDTMHGFARSSDVLFLESNYDEPMLVNGPYPFLLKKRIRGESGHLSNFDALELLNGCTDGKPSRVYFCHLSKTNNRPDLIEALCEQALIWTGTRCICHHGEVYSGSIDPGSIHNEA